MKTNKELIECLKFHVQQHMRCTEEHWHMGAEQHQFAIELVEHEIYSRMTLASASTLFSGHLSETDEQAVSCSTPVTSSPVANAEQS